MTERTPIFKRETIIKLSRLLNMKYKPTELAAELDVNVDTVYRSYLPAGAPHERDKAGNIWITGTDFRTWTLEQTGARKHKKHPLSDGDAWCLVCKTGVVILKPKIKPINRYLGMIQGTCSKCGGKVNRAISRKKSEGG